MRRSASAPGRPPVWRLWSAERTLAGPQIAVTAVATALLGVGIAVSPYRTGALTIGLLTAVFTMTTALRVAYLLQGYRARSRPTRDTAIAGHPLPVYTVLVPLYQEAEVVPDLLSALGELDYPFDRLEVLLLVEHDDCPTIAACEKHLRPGWRVVEVPAGGPRTKPNALNVGLPQTSGEFLTIYDAEDRPEPAQLRKAVHEFRQLPDQVACLQARLDYYNSEQNLLTKWFTCEYATHFSLYLEGIAELDHAIPLGGTSCHFRTSVLWEIGGWDAWNVTEDCELGMRLAAAGYRSAMLDSVTWEEAVPLLGKWIGQRSRWVKGFAQTALVLLRAPLRTAAAMGVRRYLAALATVGGVPLVLTTQIFFWSLLWAYIGLRAGGANVTPIEALFPEPLLSLGMISLLVGNFVLLLAHVSLVYQQGRFHLVRNAIFIPVYWLLMSMGAWRGIAQLARRPHFWQKTVHGLAVERSLPAPAPRPVRLAPAGARPVPREQEALLRTSVAELRE